MMRTYKGKDTDTSEPCLIFGLEACAQGVVCGVLERPGLPRTHTRRQDLYAGLEWKEFWGAAVQGGEKSNWAG